MEDFSTPPKPYCREGESESYIAVAWAQVLAPIGLLVWFLFFWAIGVIQI
jgi:hypothetical protein